ncbi:hypothetical protein BASA83_001525 [Batrachochytrium salamandrivorans]|nr:hypothetical protein BASA83_001525 [Batrachochytrium salamandrivorans]
MTQHTISNTIHNNLNTVDLGNDTIDYPPLSSSAAAAAVAANAIRAMSPGAAFELGANAGQLNSLDASDHLDSLCRPTINDHTYSMDMDAYDHDYFSYSNINNADRMDSNPVDYSYSVDPLPVSDPSRIKDNYYYEEDPHSNTNDYQQQQQHLVMDGTRDFATIGSTTTTTPPPLPHSLLPASSTTTSPPAVVASNPLLQHQSIYSPLDGGLYDRYSLLPAPTPSAASRHHQFAMVFGAGLETGPDKGGIEGVGLVKSPPLPPFSSSTTAVHPIHMGALVNNGIYPPSSSSSPFSTSNNYNYSNTNNNYGNDSAALYAVHPPMLHSDPLIAMTPPAFSHAYNGPPSALGSNTIVVDDYTQAHRGLQQDPNDLYLSRGSANASPYQYGKQPLMHQQSNQVHPLHQYQEFPATASYSPAMDHQGHHFDHDLDLDQELDTPKRHKGRYHLSAGCWIILSVFGTILAVVAILLGLYWPRPPSFTVVSTVPMSGLPTSSPSVQGGGTLFNTTFNLTFTVNNPNRFDLNLERIQVTSTLLISADRINGKSFFKGYPPLNLPREARVPMGVGIKGYLVTTPNVDVQSNLFHQINIYTDPDPTKDPAVYELIDSCGLAGNAPRPMKASYRVNIDPGWLRLFGFNPVSFGTFPFGCSASLADAVRTQYNITQ